MPRDCKFRDAAKAWWAKAESEGEQAYFVRCRVLPNDKRLQRLANDYILRPLAKKYSHRLLDVYRRLLDEYPNVNGDSIAEELAAPISHQQKLSAL